MATETVDPKNVVPFTLPVDDTSRILSKNSILDADDRDLKLFPVPEWKGSVYIGTMSGDAAIKFTEDLNDPIKKKNAMVALVALCLCDEKGEPLFTADDLPKLRAKSIKAFKRLQVACLEHNGFTDEADKKATAVDDAKKD